MLVTVSFIGPCDIEIKGEGQDQQIQITTRPPFVSIDGMINDSGACKCNTEDFQKIFLSELYKVIPYEISRNIGGITFKPISLFALKNLLFPADNTINMEKVYLPGDMIIFGNFIDNANPQ